jgi:NAD(P)-dependent dehydrogenase (short-subunit alcohol dehydrogenase family)
VAGRSIIVTGGTAGIGLAIARGLLDRGHDVFICGRDAKRLEQALDGLTAGIEPGRIGGAVCDVRDLGSVDRMVDSARRRFGGIDGLVNNAGIAFIKEFDQVTPAMWREIIETNLTGVFNCCHAALPALKEAAARKGVADIVNIGSRSGRYAFRGGSGYNTTKFGLQGMTEAMFLDLNGFGIRVGLVAPGTVGTGLGGTAPADWHLRPEDVAGAVADMIGADPRACVNWIEIRPARPVS